ncbi:2-hydroxychromene-2-carboxylate isomerase, partial [Rhizobium leguminosarum bv. viciae]|nr:2-hydroxychromene-2-carboxylate isomerase [Rhizobium leguminosarum bv. viciae]
MNILYNDGLLQGASMRTLDFYFDYRSPYSFLPLPKVAKIELEIAFHLYETGDLMKPVGNVPT